MAEVFGSDDFGNNSTLFQWRFRASHRQAGFGPISNMDSFEGVQGRFFLRLYDKRRQAHG